MTPRPARVDERQDQAEQPDPAGTAELLPADGYVAPLRFRTETPPPWSEQPDGQGE